MLLLNETWHPSSEDTAIHRCTPAGYVHLDMPRPSNDIGRTNHGDVAAILPDDVKWRIIPTAFHSKTFESFCLVLNFKKSSLV